MMEALRKIFRPTPEILAKGIQGDTAWANTSLYKDAMPKYNPDQLIGRKSHQIYKNMMNDEQVKAVVKFKRDAITSRDWFFELDDDRLSDTESEERLAIYDEMLDQVSGSFTDGMNHIMKAQWQGFSLTEKVIDTFDYRGTPYLGLKRLSPKPYETFEFFVDEYGQITRLSQWMDGKQQDLDLDRFVYVVQNPDFDEHYGQSELKEAYRSYYSKDIIIRMYNIFIERLAGGFPVISANEGTSININSKEYQELKAVLDHLQTMTGIILPAGFSLDMVTPQTTDQFEKAIVMHDLQIAKALLVPNLLGISHTGQTGTYAQAQTQLEAFLWTLNSDANRLADALNEQVFSPLSLMNFADGIGPRFKFKPISRQKMIELVKAWKELVDAKAVEPTDTDEAHLRDLFDFPEKGEPLNVTPPTSAEPTPGSQPNNEPDDSGDQDEQLPDETITGEQRRIASEAAFDRATKRVAMAVIDRKSEEIAMRVSEAVAIQNSELVSGVALKIMEDDLISPESVDQISSLQLDTRGKTKLKKIIQSGLSDGWKLGLRHATDEIAKAKGERFKVDMIRIAEIAEEYLAAQSFLMTGDFSDYILKHIQTKLMDAVRYNWTKKETIRQVFDMLTLLGIVFLENNAEVTDRTVNEILETIGDDRTPIHHVRTAIRTSLFDTINEARYSTFTDPELAGFIEAIEYSAILDARTTQICRHLDRRVYPADSPQWDSILPPNHFNCRSIIVPVTIIDTDVVGKDREGDGSRWSKPPRIKPQRGFGGPDG